MSKNSKLMKKYIRRIDAITPVEYEREALMRIFKVTGPVFITYLFEITHTNVIENNTYIISDGIIKYLIHLLERKEVNKYIKDVIYCRNTLERLNFQYNTNEWLTPMLMKISTEGDNWYIICKIFNGSVRQTFYKYTSVFSGISINHSRTAEQIIAKFGFMSILDEHNYIYRLNKNARNLPYWSPYNVPSIKLYYRVEYTTLKNMCINVILENNINVEGIPTPLLWYE